MCVCVRARARACRQAGVNTNNTVIALNSFQTGVTSIGGKSGSRRTVNHCDHSNTRRL